MASARKSQEMPRSALIAVDTKQFYSDVYRPEGHNYGETDAAAAGGSRTSEQRRQLGKYIESLGLDESAVVVEIGCGLGHLHVCHRNWRGFEYSATAVRLAREAYGSSLNIVEGDATKLPVESDSVDLLFSFAALEHIPRVDLAFSEIERVVKPGGHALLAPAWNCRPWTVKKLQQRPYAELGWRERVGKWLIPVRDNIVFRLACSVPGRLTREVSLMRGTDVPLSYRPLQPDFTLWERYPHISDDDAFVSMDAHAALSYFAARKWQLRSHPTRWRRFSCRGEEILISKPGGHRTT